MFNNKRVFKIIIILFLMLLISVEVYYVFFNKTEVNDSDNELKLNNNENINENIKIDKTKFLSDITTSYYIVTLKDNKKDVVDKYIKGMLSRKGQSIAKNSGYVDLG